MLVGELDEHIFEAGGQRVNVRDGDAVFLQLRAQIGEIEMFFHQRVDGLAKNRGAANAGNMACQTQRTRHLRRDDFNAVGAGGLHVGKQLEFRGRAVGDELAVVNVGDVAAAFGFVHVVSGDEKSDALAGKFEEQIPKLTPRDRIDAGGGFVEKKKFRFVEHGATKSQALLPAAGKLRGQAVEVRSKSVELHDFVDAALHAFRGEAVDAAVES